MLKINFLLAAGTALIPLLLGFIWYNPKLFGKAWMVGAGITEEDSKKLNMPVVFGLTYVFAFFISIALHMLTIHQFGLQSLMLEEGGKAVEGSTEEFARLMGLYGHSFRTFHHGVIHGVITGIFFVLPIVAINGMFEFRGWKYILINSGYWIVSLAIMGGIICRFA